MNKSEIEKIIIEGIKKITDINMLNKDLNLFSHSCNISPIELIYIKDYIEKKINKDISKIFISYDYNVLTVNNLADAIISLQNCITA